MKHTTLSLLLTALLGLAACAPDAGQGGNADTQGKISLLNVSYDPTREFYQEYNPQFQQYWREQHGQEVDIQQSNAGSGKQALAVRNGLKADVVSLALAGDIDAVNGGGKELIQADWQAQLPNNSTPYTSTIVFLVRKDNPKNIRDWGDLVRDDVAVITPNPKTSGGARWNFLAAWAYGRQQGGDAAAQEFVRQLYRRVPVMDSGARGSTLSFTERNLGDVLLAWENEAYLAQKSRPGEFEIITPSISILCEPPVAVVNAIAQEKGTAAVAQAYLEQLYTPAAQRLAAKHFYRPSNPEILAEFKTQFPEIAMVEIDRDFGGWQEAQQRFFADGGVFDQIYSQK
ncbi:sulfate transport system substrate-binding protein [Neisseria sp. HSC-16F19]|nr:sulfate ABC transporter substrate-binding protein [Neisseria sp. HSC-16F19]MCP2040147.1 sulfate transport system substrate-binding protein [Neisseria sp. HSC-16F19]